LSSTKSEQISADLEALNLASASHGGLQKTMSTHQPEDSLPFIKNKDEKKFFNELKSELSQYRSQKDRRKKEL
jgi:hypothetical protein